MSIEAKFSIVRGDFKLDVDLKFPAQGITAIFGPSGCGKTTLLRAFAGLEKTCTGHLKINSQVWQENDFSLPPHQRSLGYVFQEPSLFPHLNVQRNVEYGLKRVAESKRKVSIEKSIELLGIGHLLTRNIDQLSGGEKQRVAIARALATSPEILLMDEPLAALDQNLKQEIMPYLESLHKELNIPVVYVSHSADEVARLADHLVLLEDGKVKASGPICDMLTRLDLSLAQGEDAEALIEAEVAGHDDEYNLTYLNFPGGQFTVTQNSSLAIGQSVRLRITARDVSLTLEHQTGTSILNIFPVIIDEIIPKGGAQVTVRLLAEGVPLLSRVTKKSAALLELKVGKMVYAQAKSVALLS
jgi:molybdate transport system ATP-binding protein